MIDNLGSAFVEIARLQLQVHCLQAALDAALANAERERDEARNEVARLRRVFDMVSARRHELRLQRDAEREARERVEALVAYLERIAPCSVAVARRALTELQS